MGTKYYADANGAYLGGFAPAPPYEIRTPQDPITDPQTGEVVDQPPLVETVTPEVVPPDGGIEVPNAPAHGLDIWDFETDTWIPYTPPVLYPNLTARQLRLMLLNVGITAAMVDAEIAAIADEAERAAAQIEWQHASGYRRDHPLIAEMAAAFALPAEQVDALWLAAADL